jgi:hypothetical protein
MTERLAGRVAFITGAARGQGTRARRRDGRPPHHPRQRSDTRDYDGGVATRSHDGGQRIRAGSMSSSPNAGISAPCRVERHHAGGVQGRDGRQRDGHMEHRDGRRAEWNT